MLGFGNGGRLVALEREMAALRQELIESATREVGDRRPGDTNRLQEEVTALTQRVEAQDGLIAGLTVQLSHALTALDEGRQQQDRQRRYLTRLAALQRGRSARARAVEERLAAADLSLRRLFNRVDLEAEQSGKGMTALVEKIDAILRSKPI